MEPYILAALDQLRARLQQARNTPCICGNCDDADLDRLLAMTDDELLAYARGES